MIFLNPIWFCGLAALSIPLMIHLWNIRPGKTLKVGSISLITEASKSNRRSLKLLDILLLLLRCFLLALVATVLAAPVWRKANNAKNVKGWLLIPKENFKETYAKFKPKADSLIAAGYEFHYFGKRFAKADLKKLLADSTLTDSTQTTANYWGLIKQLHRQIPATLPVYVFTSNGINHFNGDRPSVGMNLHWETYTVADSTAKWIAGAWLSNANNIKVTVGKSSPAGISFTDQYLQNEGNADVAVDVQNGIPVVTLKKGSQMPIRVDTSTLTIAIYTDKYQLDAHYLKAAIDAATRFSGRNAVVREYSNAGQIPGGLTWLFWLSDRPVDARVAKNSRQIFKYEPGKVAGSSSWINTGEFYAPPGAEQVKLFKRVVSGDKAQNIWHDGFGNAILGLEKSGSVGIYHCYTHFNPSWNNLVWSDSFPRMMLQLVAGGQLPIPAKYDKRVLIDQQLQPAIFKDAKKITTQNSAGQTDLSQYIWFLLVLIFIAERMLAYRQKGAQANG